MKYIFFIEERGKIFIKFIFKSQLQVHLWFSVTPSYSFHLLCFCAKWNTVKSLFVFEYLHCSIQAPRTSRASLVKGRSQANAGAQQALIAHWQSIVKSLNNYLKIMKANYVSYKIYSSCYFTVYFLFHFAYSVVLPTVIHYRPPLS